MDERLSETKMAQSNREIGRLKDNVQSTSTQNEFKVAISCVRIVPAPTEVS